MEQVRQVAVLFADISDSTKLYESEGDKAAMEAIARCLERLRQIVGRFSGRVVKTMGDEIMALFATPDAAASASSAMQRMTETLPPVGATKLGLRIGFHYGPVIQRDRDVFGDTVNLASRLVEQAGSGQIIISQETSDKLGEGFRRYKRPLYAIHVKGKADQVGLCELIWREADDLTMSFAAARTVKLEPQMLRLKFRDLELIRRRAQDSVSIGRDTDCDIVSSNSRVSRRHCTIERRQDQFILRDHSTNGTYVTADGSSEILLRREEIRLVHHGWIALGQPRAAAQDSIEYFRE